MALSMSLALAMTLAVRAHACCAMHSDGSYATQLAVMKGVNGSLVYKSGAWGIDVPHRTSGMFVGDAGCGVEDSDAGFLLTGHTGGDYTGVWWADKECHCIDLPQSFPLGMCVGGSSQFPTYESSSRVDLLTTLDSYRSTYGSMIAVARLTCMPFYAVHTPSAAASSFLPLESPWAIAGSGGAVVFMVNATAHPPRWGSLTAPSYCKSAGCAASAHRSRSSGARLHAAPQAARGA